jgi:regulator of protease activity HflC (stomatin/prohibitin superfamily)
MFVFRSGCSFARAKARERGAYMTTTIFNRDVRKDVPNDNGFGGMGRNFSRIAIIGGAFLIGGIVLFNVFRVTRINAGYVGVEVNLAGSQRGAQDIPIRTGWVFYSPLKTQVIEFPTFVQTVKWTSDLNEGHPINEELVFNSKEGQEVRADVSLSYGIDATKVPEFYVKYRTDDLERFTHGILKDIVRNSLNEVASTYTLEDIYGENKARFLREAANESRRNCCR